MGDVDFSVAMTRWFGGVRSDVQVHVVPDGVGVSVGTDTPGGWRTVTAGLSAADARHLASLLVAAAEGVE